ncbi:MAG: conjugal transfer protein TraF [Candidatus Bathyarchaeia archaeon]
MVARVVLLLLTMVLFIFPVWAQSSEEPLREGKKPYYQAPTKEGWWWYKDSVKPEKKEETKKEDKKPEQPVQAFTPKPLKEYSYEELLYMHPDEFAKIYDYYLKKAVQKPTEESVYEFYNLQDVARKKALLFSHLSGYVWQKYPELSTERDVPISGPGMTKQRDLVAEELKAYARRVSQFGYVVFVQPGCGYCEAQLKILKYAEADGIPVKVVDISRAPSVRAKFAIEVTPTIIVVDQKTGQYLPISAGVVSLDEIYTRTARAIRLMSGEESPARYGIYEFQKGTSLDPLEPPPLWRDKKVREVK